MDIHESFRGSYWHVRPWKYVKAMNNILPLRRLHGGHGSFNGFNGTRRSSHGTRGSFHGNFHGLPPKVGNHAGGRPQNFCVLYLL